MASTPARLVALGFVAIVLAGRAHAAEPGNGEEERLRATLKATMVQLQSAQDQLAALQATQSSLADEKKSLAAKYEALKKQAVADKTAADQALNTLRAEAAGQKTQIAQLQQALDQARAEGGGAVQALRNAQRWGLEVTQRNQALGRRVSDLESKNLALFLIGNEILGRYEDFSLGNALSAKEPFVGRTRAKLENLVQEYQDKLLDQRAR